MQLGIIFFLLLTKFIYAFEENFKIRGSFQLCQATDILIETSVANMDSQIFNFLTFIKSMNKEFTEIKLPLNEILYVFSRDGNLFLANCSTQQNIYLPLRQPKCYRDLLVFIDSNKTKEYFLNHKSKIISEKSILCSCKNIKKKIYIDSYEISQVSDKIKVRILKSVAKEIKFHTNLKTENLNNADALIRLNITLEALKVELFKKNETITPLPLKNLLINEEKILQIIKEKESEITDEVSKFFTNSILNKKILVGISIIIVYIFFSFILFRFLFLFYVKITKHPFFDVFCIRKNKKIQNIDQILEVPEIVNPGNDGLIISKNDLFLNSFFKSFTKLNEKEFSEKIKQEKKFQKNVLIDIQDVSSIRKGLDCIHDVNLSEIENYFYKNAKPQLQMIIDTFNSSDYYCPSCRKTLSEKSVVCEKCNRWFDMKCVKNVGSLPWYCHEELCIKLITN
jgi:hypothetical protein